MLHVSTRRLIWLLVLILYPLAASGQKRPITIDDYPAWKSIAQPTLSDDGQWMRYTYRPNEGDDTLFFKSLVSIKIYDTFWIAGAAEFGGAMR